MTNVESPRSMAVKQIDIDTLNALGAKLTYEQIGSGEVTQEGTFPFEARKAEIERLCMMGNPIGINGEPGSGKTFGMVMVMDTIFGKVGQGIMTEPRVDLTLDVANKMTKALRHPVGHIVRDDVKNPDAKVVIMTDGVAIARLFNPDDVFEGVAAIDFDEVNQMNANIILGLSQIPDLQKRRAAKGLDPIQVIFSTARMNKKLIHDKFPDTQFVDIPGRAKEIDVYWHDRDVRPEQMPEEIAQKLLWALLVKKKTGRAIVFCAGEEEIERAAKAFEAYGLKDRNIRRYHGNIPKEEQNAILDKSPSDSNDIIFMTEKGAVGLDLEAEIVIASGLVNRSHVDQETGQIKLLEEEASQEELDQMRGRTSRVTKAGAQIGLFLPMYTKQNYQARDEFRRPEVLGGCDLAPHILRIIASGVANPKEYNWFVRPPDTDIDYALMRLLRLGAIDNHGRITAHGKELAKLEIELKSGISFIEARTLGVGEQMATIAAFLEHAPRLFESRDVHVQARLNSFIDYDSDMIGYLRWWEEFVKNGSRENWAFDHGVRPAELRRILGLRKELMNTIPNANANKKYNIKDRANLDLAIARGFLVNLMLDLGNQTYINPLFENTVPMVRDPNSHSNRFDHIFVAAGSMTTQYYREPRAKIIHPLTIQTLEAVHPGLAQHVTKVLADLEQQRAATTENRQPTNTTNRPPEAQEARREAQQKQAEQAQQQAEIKTRREARLNLIKTLLKAPAEIVLDQLDFLDEDEYHVFFEHRVFSANRDFAIASQAAWKPRGNRSGPEVLTEEVLTKHYQDIFERFNITSMDDLTAALNDHRLSEADLRIRRSDYPLPPKLEPIKMAQPKKKKPGFWGDLRDAILEAAGLK